VRLDDLRGALRNPKEHDLPSIVESISKHGFVDPIIVCDRTERIASGHGRLEALIYMRTHHYDLPAGLVIDEDGEWAVPVQRGWASKDDAHLEAYIILANQLTIAGGWNDKLLAEMLHDIHGADPALFDAIGFTADEMDDLFRQVDPERWDKEDDEGGLGGGEGDEPPPGQARPEYVECPMCLHQFDPTRNKA